MNITQKLVDTMTWAASADKQVDLPNDSFITEIDLELSLTMSGSGAAALATHGLWRAIQSLKIAGGSGKDYYSMSGVQMGVLMHYLNLVDYPTIRTWHEIVATTQIVSWKLHFGSRPYDIFGRRNPCDLSAALPAMDEANLKLTWTCTPANALDDIITISSGTMRVTVHKVQAVNEAQELAIKRGLYVPVSSSEAYDPGATKSNLSGQRFVPTGNYLKRIVIAAQDDTGVGSNGPLFVGNQVTEVGIKLAKANTWLIDAVRTAQLQLNNPKFDGMEVVDTPNVQSPWAPAGFYLLDLRQYDKEDLGLDTRGLGSNDVILGLTIGAYASGEVEQIWYEQYEPYSR